jgi:hypothetical protein
VKVINKIESLEDKVFKKLKYFMYFIFMVISIVTYMLKDDFFSSYDYFYIKVIIYFSINLLLCVIFITTILFSKIREYSKRSLIFENKDKYFLEKEYNLFIDLIKEGEKILFRVVYLFFLSEIGVFLFFFNHLNNIEKISEKIGTVLNNEIFFTIFIFLWIPFFLMSYILFFNEKINLFYLNKLTNVSVKKN